MKRIETIFAVFVVALLGFGTLRADVDPTPDEVVHRAMAEAPDIDGQAMALMRLAWPSDGSSDPEIQSRAREKLVNFGAHGMVAFQYAIRNVDPLFSADVVSAMIQARLQVTSGIPGGYQGALEDAIWYGSPDARRLATHKLALQHFGPALLAVIDSIYEQPESTAIIVQDLGRWGDPRARFELRRVLDRGTPRERRLAAEALARIGGQATEELRDATLSQDSLTRRSSITAFLPESNVNDLTALYEYIAEYGEEDPELTEKILDRARQLESVLEAQQDSSAASPGLDD